nr:hypothetical protein [Tanacetum cinerariifolium]
MESDRWPQIHAAISSIYKGSTMARRLLSRKGIGFLKRTGLTTPDLRPHMESDRWPQIHAAINSIYKSSTMARRLLSRKGIGFLKRTGLTTWSASDADISRIFS